MIGTRRLIAPRLALLLVAGSMPLFAQEPAGDAAKPATTPAPAQAPAQAPAEKRAFDPSRRVPGHFGQVGLTPDQKESIYKIRKAHLDRIEALRAEIAGVEAKSMKECEAVLTETQRKLLENLRSGAASRTPTRRATETAKAAE